MKNMSIQTLDNMEFYFLKKERMNEFEANYLGCDEWTTGIYCRRDEVDELALVLTVDFTVELCEPVRIGL